VNRVPTWHKRRRFFASQIEIAENCSNEERKSPRTYSTTGGFQVTFARRDWGTELRANEVGRNRQENFKPLFKPFSNVLTKNQNRSTKSMAGGLGFEPRLTESESAVLPLNYPPVRVFAAGFFAPLRRLRIRALPSGRDFAPYIGRSQARVHPALPKVHPVRRAARNRIRPRPAGLGTRRNHRPHW
jgi:hypothetical protein